MTIFICFMIFFGNSTVHSANENTKTNTLLILSKDSLNTQVSDILQKQLSQ